MHTKYTWLPWWISRCKNDDIEYDAKSIDCKAEEDAVLIVLVNDAPDEGEEEEDVVKEDRLAWPVSQACPGDEDKMTQEQHFEF